MDVVCLVGGVAHGWLGGVVDVGGVLVVGGDGAA